MFKTNFLFCILRHSLRFVCPNDYVIVSVCDYVCPILALRKSEQKFTYD